ncbi:hypothetical protein [Halobellus limi]|uniref:Uncharacterized protein n=1 Tax=Halobellus limi TaxID=699433 RepID=A0A1H6BUP6_9EURY|nr:hypothetical protein [Halobellus limi]QCC49458.1 hypothetical protein DV707_17180 [Halobellus limi]SEG64383.1 hypothetical protein SAMN04488133_3047 [Halobellus limi]
MRTKLALLAVAALLALGTGSVVAAMDTPTADTASDDALPANYTVDVINSGEVSDEEVDQVIETAWANHTVRSYFDEVTAVHFEVWASELDENVIHVKIAPIEEPDETRVITDVNLSKKQVTYIDEPVKLNASNAITIDATDYDLNDTEHSQNTNNEENATRLTADQATQIELNESSIERGGDGTFTLEVEDDDETTTTVPSEEIIRIDLSPENQTVNGE